MTKLQLLLIASCLGIPAVSGFLLRPQSAVVTLDYSRHSTSPPAFQTVNNMVGSISEWRDIMFEYPGTGDDRRLGTEQGAPPRQVNILPFPFDQILLQGETKQLRLYEERFIKLFEDTMDNHCGVLAMGLMAQAGIVQKVPLCEIEAYNRMDNFGIFVTIRVVGRAELLEVTQQEPYIQAVCVELADKVPPNLELPNLLAKNIEDSVESLSTMERRLQEVQENTSSTSLNQAQLEDRFYEGVEEDDDDDDDEDNEGASDLDRQARYETAYRIALATDTQGYFLASTDSSYGKTPQELTAISWAGFCTDIVPEIADATYRIQAMDSEDLFERLKLASHMLKQKEKQLKAELVKAGLEEPGEEGSSSDGKGQ